MTPSRCRGDGRDLIVLKGADVLVLHGQSVPGSKAPDPDASVLSLLAAQFVPLVTPR